MDYIKKINNILNNNNYDNINEIIIDNDNKYIDINIIYNDLMYRFSFEISSIINSDYYYNINCYYINVYNNKIIGYNDNYDKDYIYLLENIIFDILEDYIKKIDIN